MTEALLKGLALGFILTMSVGPVIFTVIKQSINYGKEGGFSFISGVWISDIILVVIANMLSEWVTRLLEYKQALGYVGSAFLGVMGVYFVFFKKVNVKTDAEVKAFQFGKFDFARLALSGFLINTLNPNVIFFWLLNATAVSATHSLNQRAIIFSSCLLLNMAADVFKVIMAGKLRERLTLHTMRIVNRVSGTILIGFGLALFYGAMFIANRS